MRKLWFSAVTIACLMAVYAFAVEAPRTVSTINHDHTQGTVKWMSFEEAVAAIEKDKKSGRKPKKMFIDVYTDWCGWCKKMDKETFETPDVAAYLNKHFYAVKLNAEQRADIQFAGHTFKFVAQGSRGYHELAASLLDGQMSYPTVVFLNEEVQLLQRIPGYLDIPTFDTILHYLAEEHYKTTPWAEFQQKYAQSKGK